MKRVISVILVAALVLALLPTFAFAAESSAESYVYNFKSGLHSSSAYVTQCTEWTSTDSNEGEWVCVTYNHTGNGTNAGKHNTSYFSFRPKVSSADMMPTYSPGIALDTSTQFMSALTLKIEVKKDGIYTPSVSLATEDSSPKWEVFLTKVEEEVNSASHSAWIGRLNSSNRLGTIDGYGSGEGVSRTFLNRELEAGSYYLTFVTNGKNDLCEFTNEATGVYRVELLLKSFALKNVNDIEVLEDINYNLTSSALADPSTASNYCDTDVTDSVWHCTNLLKLGYGALAEGENKFAYVGDIYTRAGSISETGVISNLWSGRYVYNSAYFTDNDGDGKMETVASGAAYGTSTNVAIKINVPKAGKYKLYLYNQNADAYGCLANVYFADSTVVSEYSSTNIDGVIEDKDAIYRLTDRFDSAVVHADGIYLGDVSVSADDMDCFIIFSPDYDTFKINRETHSVARSGFQTLHLSGIKLEPIVEENTDLIEEQEKFDEIEKIKTDEIAKPVDSGLSNVATVNILETEINSDEAFEQTARKVTGTYGEMMTVVANPKAGYEFLYWAKGIGNTRKVVSENAEYKFKAVSGGTWLTAVYKNKASTDVSVVFYNGNGEEVSRQLVEQGNQITMPALPTLRGHEASTGWAIGNREELYAAGDDVTATGSQMLFVAQFNDPSKSISVKVNGADYGTYAYGDKVTVTATERENGNGDNVFVYWKKGDEIVSFDKTYSFLASDNCELTACYNAYRPITDALKKIVISGSGQNIMAEFIGLGDAVEKGIIFDENSAENITFSNATHKITMTQDGNQLAAVADIGTYIGYAILADGNVIYDK